MSPRVDTITVNYQCADEILARVPGVVRDLEHLGQGRYWVVDNASPDGSGATLEKALSDVPAARFLASGRNGGFGAGNNVAIRAALADPNPPDYLYFLNPDADPMEGAVRSLCQFLEDNPRVGVVGGALCDEDGTVSTSMFRFPSFQSEIEAAIQLGVVRSMLISHVQSLDTPDAPMPVDWVAGTSFMVRREVFETAGLFDEEFFLYWEETELCHRIKQSGWEIWGVPDAMVMHIGGLTTGMHDAARAMPPYWYKSRDHFYRKTGLVRRIGLMNLAVVAGVALRRCHQALRGRAFDSPGYLRDFIKFSRFVTKPRTPDREAVDAQN